jgi:hypothetical protein
MKVQQELNIVGQHSGDDDVLRLRHVGQQTIANSKIVRFGPYSVTSTEK